LGPACTRPAKPATAKKHTNSFFIVVPTIVLKIGHQ
jgi:hypothetical protein